MLYLFQSIQLWHMITVTLVLKKFNCILLIAYHVKSKK